MTHPEMLEVLAEDRAITKAITPVKPPEIVVKFERPPNYKAIVAAFPAVAHRRGVIFSYGLTIYNPDRVVLTRSLHAHEQVHSRRQGSDPAAWWEKYVGDKAFRLEEELVAHQVEYMVEVDGAGRQVRRRALSIIAARLASRIYGRMVSLDEAKRLITGAWNGAAF